MAAVLESLIGAMVVAGDSTVAASGTDIKGLDREFIKNAKFGIFVHYMRSTPYSFGKPNPTVWDMDAQATAFDVKAFTDSVEEMGAQYVTMTAFHAAMYLLGPNKVMTGIGMPKHQTKRDMLDDLAEELKKRGIVLCLYVHPVDQHDLSQEEQAPFGLSNCLPLISSLISPTYSKEASRPSALRKTPQTKK